MRYLPPLSWLGVLKLLRDANMKSPQLRDSADDFLPLPLVNRYFEGLLARGILIRAIVRSPPTSACGSGVAMLSGFREVVGTER